MTAPEWCRVNRGRVWHLVTGPDTVLCEGGLYGGVASVPYLEVTRSLPPRGGRPCPRCCAQVSELADVVRAAQQASTPFEPETYGGREVETVDLVTALAEADQ